MVEETTIRTGVPPQSGAYWEMLVDRKTHRYRFPSRPCCLKATSVYIRAVGLTSVASWVVRIV